MRTQRAFCSILAVLGLFTPTWSAFAQERTIETQQLWFGYLTQIRFSNRYSWWNDAHFVPGAFYVLRTGLSYHLAHEMTATVGYAFLGLPVGSVTRDLKRREHRPWGQVVYNPRLGENWSLLNRLRYDARIRRNIEDGRLAPGYGFTNRGRLLALLRRDFPTLEFGDRMIPYMSVGNEVLIHWRAQGTGLDQNRAIAGFGVVREGIALQMSYMNRYVQLGSNSAAGSAFVMNHTLVVWVFHNFDLRRGGD